MFSLPVYCLQRRHWSQSGCVGSRVFALRPEFSARHAPPSRPSELNLQAVQVRAQVGVAFIPPAKHSLVFSDIL